MAGLLLFSLAAIATAIDAIRPAAGSTTGAAIVRLCSVAGDVAYCDGGGGINGPSVGGSGSTCGAGVKGFDCMSSGPVRRVPGKPDSPSTPTATISTVVRPGEQRSPQGSYITTLEHRGSGRGGTQPRRCGPVRWLQRQQLCPLRHLGRRRSDSGRLGFRRPYRHLRSLMGTTATPIRGRWTTARFPLIKSLLRLALPPRIRRLRLRPMATTWSDLTVVFSSSRVASTAHCRDSVST